MYKTDYPEINAIILELVENIKNVLGDNLVGIYLGGSLVIGEFDKDISDIDLVAAVSEEISDHEFQQLKQMHNDFVTTHPEWDDRIEVCYISVNALQHIKSEPHYVVNISPGEPINKRKTSKHWLMNWYITREESKTLFGPDPKTIIEPISHEEFIACVKEHVKEWPTWILHMTKRSQQAYAIITLCRSYYTITNGEQVSKKQAAEWASQQLPEYKELIEQAVEWRRDWKNENIDHQKTYPQTINFVNEMVTKILNS